MEERSLSPESFTIVTTSFSSSSSFLLLRKNIRLGTIDHRYELSIISYHSLSFPKSRSEESKFRVERVNDGFYNPSNKPGNSELKKVDV